MSNNSANENLLKKNQEQQHGRGGVKFGTDVSYDDAYGDEGPGKDGYVTSLPTEEEERRMLENDPDSDVLKREEMEMLDIGRIGNGGASHPSSLAAANAQKVCFRELVLQKRLLNFDCYCQIVCQLKIFSNFYKWSSPLSLPLYRNEISELLLYSPDFTRHSTVSAYFLQIRMNFISTLLLTRFFGTFICFSILFSSMTGRRPR